MPGIAPQVLHGLVARAGAGDTGAISELLASGYDVTGKPTIARPAPLKRRTGPVPSSVQAQRANTYARLLRRMVGK